MTDYLDDLIAKARAATPGPWHVSKSHDENDCDVWGVSDAKARLHYRDNFGHDQDAAFIAAANPTVILALCERVRELEQALKPFAAFVPSSIYSDDGSESEEVYEVFLAGRSDEKHDFSGADFAAARTALARATAQKETQP